MNSPPRSRPRTFATGVLVALACALLLVPAHVRAQTDVDSIYRFGIQQLEDGDIENAINTFRKVLELDPEYALAHSSLGYIYLTRGNVELARPSFERALQLKPDLAAAHNGIGLIQAREERTRNSALDSFRQALRLDPDYLDARYNLGVTLTDMEQYGQARQAFDQVLEKDPQYRDVHYRLGVIALADKDYVTAERELKDQYRLDANNKENRLELGRLYFQTERFEEAENILLPMLQQYPDYVPSKLLLADVYLAVKDYERANQLYLMSYREFDDSETANRLWRDVVDIAHDWERAEYKDTPLDKMPDFFRRFWKRRDPDPTTDDNEVLVEHYRRLRHVREYFASSAMTGGYDDRGRVYLKHGEPDTEVGFPTGDAETRGNISWEYHTGLKERLIVHFVDRGNGYFSEAESLMEASMTIPLGIMPAPNDEANSEISPSAELWVNSIPVQVYRARAVIDPIYDRIANQMEDLRRNAQGPGGGSDVARTDQERLERMLTTERMDNLQDIATLSSTNTYAALEPVNPLPFNFYTAAFKDIQNKTRLEVYYGLPTAQVGYERYGEGQKVTVDLGVGVFDSDWNEIHRSNDTREYVSNGPVQQALGAVIVDLNRLAVQPGVYNFAISVEDKVTGRRNVYRDSLRVSDFTSRNLALSDIEIAGRVEESSRGGRFYRDGLEIVPMPSRTFTTAQKIWIYYEIYSLTKDDFGTTQFQTSYTIRPADAGRQRNVLSSAFRSLGRLVGIGKEEAVTVEGDVEYGIRAEEHKYLELAFPNPSPGIYEVVLNVKDRNTGQQTQQIQQFMVTPPAEGGR